MMCFLSKFKINHLIKNEFLFRERDVKPRFAEPNTIEYTIGLKWKQLELQEKQLLEEVKRRMQYASEQLQVEIDQMLLENEAQLLRDGRKFLAFSFIWK
jgi:proline- and glutamine-rich splicing factor